MAKYRPIFTCIWRDPDGFEQFSAMEKLLFIYLCTNPLTTESGIYPISIKSISVDTGIPFKRVGELLHNGLKNVAYDFDNSIVFVKNFLFYNGLGSTGGRPEYRDKSIYDNYKKYNTTLWEEFFNTYPEYKNIFSDIEKLNPSTTVGKRFYSNSNSNININSNKEEDYKGKPKLNNDESIQFAKGIAKENDWNNKKEKRYDTTSPGFIEFKELANKLKG